MGTRRQLWPTQCDEDRDAAAWAPHACSRADRQRVLWLPHDEEGVHPVCGIVTPARPKEEREEVPPEWITGIITAEERETKQRERRERKEREWRSASPEWQEELVKFACREVSFLPIEQVRARMPWPWDYAVVLPRYGLAGRWPYVLSERFLCLQDDGLWPAGRCHSI